MAIDELLETAKREGFNSIEEFVRDKIHYLSKEKKEIFDRANILSDGYYKKEKNNSKSDLLYAQS